jgi:prolyl 4-hydroxylase
LRYRIVSNFLKSEECKKIIEMAKLRLEPSSGWNVKNGKSELSDYRISDQMFFTIRENYLISLVEEKIADMTGIPIENGEGLQVVRYLQGGYYKVHSDYFDLEWPGNQLVLNRGGQRIVTVLLYLNDLDLVGGETYFPYIDLKVEPKKGIALIWYNIDNGGRIDRSTLHEAKPVKKGEKWIATKWLRERKFY